MATPQLAPIKGGWAAMAERWAVRGATQEEALRRFAEAEEMHREIRERAKQEQDNERQQSGEDGT